MKCTNSHSTLWILVLAGSFAIANPHTVYAPTSAAEVTPAVAQEVPVDSYLDLGVMQRGETSTGYTVAQPVLSRELFSAVSDLPSDFEHRYTDMGCMAYKHPSPPTVAADD